MICGCEVTTTTCTQGCRVGRINAKFEEGATRCLDFGPYSIPRDLVEPLDLDFLEYSPVKEHCDGNSSVVNSATE